MNTGFNAAAQKKDNITVDLSDLYRAVGARLEKAYQRQGLTSNFNQQNTRAGAEDSLLGSLIFSSLTWGAFFAGMEAAMPAGCEDALDIAQAPVVAAVIDGIGLVTDEQARKNRARIINALYPKGRRQDPIVGAKKRDSFNLVAANQNSNFTYDLEAEIACMSEILDMLDKLAKNNVTLVSIDAQAPVYDTLKASEKNMGKTSTLNNRFMMPVRKAA